MRKPRDFDSDMKALAERTKVLRERKVRSLGELVMATEADGLDLDVLAGVLIAAVAVADAAKREEWRRRGVRFFQGTPTGDAGGTTRGPGGVAEGDGGATQA